MKDLVKNLIKRFGPSFLFYQKSYAQEGEDLVVNRLLEGKRNGFYVEVGAHHPFRFSNTYFFYKKGWSGICIDPLPGVKKLFKKSRPRDLALEMGISSAPGTLEYFMFNEPALNTFDAELAKSRNGLKDYKITRQVSMDTLPLSQVLEDQKIPASGIDLLSVDVEGLDLEVLASNDWKLFLPKVIIAEALSSDVENIHNDPIYQFLISKGYTLYAKTGCSIIFTLSD